MEGLPSGAYSIGRGSPTNVMIKVRIDLDGIPTLVVMMSGGSWVPRGSAVVAGRTGCHSSDEMMCTQDPAGIHKY